MRKVRWSGLYILKDLVVEPTVVKTVSKTRVSLENVRLDFESNACLLHELSVPKKKRPINTNKLHK
jgi:hypothetical protein